MKSELTKKRMRYEILEDMESFLQQRIKGREEEIEWRENLADEGGEIPDWRLDEIQDLKDRIAEIREVIKALPKLG